MVKTISKNGNSEGLIFDAVLLHMAHLQAGDPVNVVVHEGGTITLTSLRPRPSPKEVSDVIQKPHEGLGPNDEEAGINFSVDSHTN